MGTIWAVDCRPTVSLTSIYQHTALQAMSALQQCFTVLLLLQMQFSSFVIQLIPSIFLEVCSR